MDLKVKDIAYIAVLSSILFVQEQVLSFLPNIQLTFFLIILYSKVFKTFRTSIIIIIHVLLDNLVLGSFNILYTPFMLTSYLIIPITINTIFKKVNSPLILALLGSLYSLLYCWSFIIPQIILLDINIKHYIIADIPFEILLVVSTFLSIFWLYEPFSKRLLLILEKK